MSDPSDLSNLRDIVVPPELALWPPAPGWWILLAGGLAMAAMFAGMVVARHRRNAYRRAALVALDGADAGDISTILKRAALAAWPRAEVASLTGADWLAFLDRTTGSTVFTQGAGRDLEALAFGGTGDKQAVLVAARNWVRRHRC